VLGPVAVRRDGTEVPVTSRAQRRILAALAEAPGTVVSIGALASLLWDDDPPETARGSLKSHVSRLRRALRPDAVAARPPGYALTVPPEHIDAHRFEAGLRAAGNVEELDHLLDLWRGPPFGELADHPHFAGAVARLCELNLQARSHRAELLDAAGDHERGAAEWSALVEDQPLREPAWIGLVRSLHAGGRQADAVAAAGRYRDEVAAVGLEPSAEFTTAERRIFTAVPAGPLPPTPVTGLPAAATDLVGRGRELPSILDLLPRQRLVTLVGPGGVGKTRLAVEVARRVGGDLADERALADGIWMASFTDVQPGGAVVPTVVRAVGAPTTPPLDRSLEQYLARRRCLLVLDNAEHVLASVRALVQRLLAESDSLHLLTTSRQALGIPGEVVVPIGPLDPDAALQLFTERARDSGIEVRGQEQLAARVCEQLDRLPLAIEMASGRLRALGLQDLAERLDERLHLLSSAAGARDRTLEEVIRWSYDLLDPTQRSLLDQLSVFAGSFDLDSAEAVTDIPHVAGVLADLVERSLLQADTAGGRARYQMLETIRAFAAEQLRASDRHLATTRRFVHHHVDLSERIDAGLRSPDEVRWMDVLEASTANLEAALTAAVADEDVDAASRIAAGPYVAVYQRLRADIGAWAEAALDLARRDRHPKASAIAAIAALNRLNQGDVDGAATLLSDLPDHPDARHGHEVLGELHVYCGELDRSIAALGTAEALAEQAADEFTRLNARMSRAIALGYAGAVHEALELVEDVHRAAVDSGLGLIEAWCEYALGELLADTDPDRALELVDRSVGKADAADWRMLAGAARLTASSLRARTTDPVAAVDGFRQLIEHWRDMGDHTHQWTTLRNLVELLTRLDEDESAARLVGTVSHQDAIPTFGPEAARVDHAMVTVRSRLGADADELIELGRDEDLATAVERALATLRRIDERSRT